VDEIRNALLLGAKRPATTPGSAVLAAFSAGKIGCIHLLDEAATRRKKITKQCMLP
jgi:hypothetical protein